MTKHYQKGDAGVVMLVVMVAMMIGFFWHGGAKHSGDRSNHMSSGVYMDTAAELPLDPLEKDLRARDEISHEK